MVELARLTTLLRQLYAYLRGRPIQGRTSLPIRECEAVDRGVGCRKCRRRGLLGTMRDMRS